MGGIYFAYHYQADWKNAESINRHRKSPYFDFAADGYTHIIVQGTNVIDGIEAEVLRNDAKLMTPFSKEIRVGRPLLYSVDDCQNVVGILINRYGKTRRRTEP